MFCSAGRYTLTTLIALPIKLYGENKVAHEIVIDTRDIAIAFGDSPLVG